MHSKWIEKTKKADFRAWAEALSVSPLTARMLRNRGAETIEEAQRFLFGSLEDLSPRSLMKDLSKAAELLLALRTDLSASEGGQAVSGSAGMVGYSSPRVMIASDYDDDGIFAAEILSEGLTAVGIPHVIKTPDRMAEGYGLNLRMIDDAAALGVSLILTCDNGIAAMEEIKYAKSRGLTVVVTDHHEPQYDSLPADAVVDPKQKDCPYPFKELCGAGVAFRLVEEMYEKAGIPKEKAYDLLEYVAIATIADVVPLSGENRILVREGMARLKKTEKPSLLALMDASDIKPDEMDAYRIGFVICPCFNAVSRVTGKPDIAQELLRAKSYEEAMPVAVRMRELNESRKAMTESAVRAAEEMIKEKPPEGPVWLLPIPGVLDTVVGIVAGKIKEEYYHPVFVLTGGETGGNGDNGGNGGTGIWKASGRSIPGYHMQNALMECKDLLLKFGGHAMAAGLSVEDRNLPALRQRLNENCQLTPKDLVPVSEFDARVPLSAVNETIVEEMNLLAPFGTGNASPSFVAPRVLVSSLRVFGKNRNVLKMSLCDAPTGSAPTGSAGSPSAVSFWTDAYQLPSDGILFGTETIETFLSFIRTEFGEEELEKALSGRKNAISMAVLYVPEINEYMGRRSIQLRILDYCRI